MVNDPGKQRNTDGSEDLNRPVRVRDAAGGNAAADAATRDYSCPSHPDVHSRKPGICPKCDRPLEPSPSLAERADQLALSAMTLRFWISFALAAPLVLIAMSDLIPSAERATVSGMTRFGWSELALATPVVLWGGLPFFGRAWHALLHGRLNMFSLIALGIGAAYTLSVVTLLLPQLLPESMRVVNGEPALYFESAAIITVLVLLGQVLELRARTDTSGAVRALLQLPPAIAHRVDPEGHETEVNLDQLQVQDRLRVHPGEKIPVDGVVLEGSSYIDESMITGESGAVHKAPGAAITGGTRNGDSALLICALKIGADTLLSQIVRQVSQAQHSRAPLQRAADRMAAWFVPLVLACAAVTAVLWLQFGPEPNLAYAVTSTLAVLIVASPCALWLATPISIRVGVDRAAQSGILIKDAAAIERLEFIDTVVVAKTGTLTEGRPSLHGLHALDGIDPADLASHAAALEALSDHPLARAIVAGVKARGFDHALTVTDFASDLGRGISGIVAGRPVLVGNAALLERARIPTAELQVQAEHLRVHGHTAVLVAIDGKPAGVLEITDAVKPSSIEAVQRLKALDIRVLMLSGDHAQTARSIGDGLGIDVIADLLPDGKADAIKQLQAQQHIVAMAAGGINDAPALAQADVGIATDTSTDIAMESAGVTLLSGDLRGIATAIALSRRTMTNIRQNLVFAFGYNVLAIPIAAGALQPVLGLQLSPMVASAAMTLSSASVIFNALRLRRMPL